MKKFTIITAAYNSAQYIDQCIESVININYNLKNIQHIIVDDGSSDQTFDIIKKYKEKYPHIELYKKQNGNWGSVINYVISRNIIKNDYVTILDSDDKIHKNIFYKINKTKKFDLTICSFYFTNKNRKIYFPSTWNLFKKRYIDNIPQPPVLIPLQCFIKKEIFINLKPLKEGISHQDIILFNDLFSKINTCQYLKNPSGYYWYCREDNSFNQVKSSTDTKTFKNIIEILNSSINTKNISRVSWTLLINKNLQQYLIQNNIKIKSNIKVSFKWFPIWIRFFAYIYFKIFLSKFFFIKENKK